MYNHSSPFLTFENIAAFHTDLIGVISRGLLKWDVITQHKSLSIVQVMFVGTAKQVIVDEELMTDEDHHLNSSEEKKVVTSKAELKKE